VRAYLAFCPPGNPTHPYSSLGTLAPVLHAISDAVLITDLCVEAYDFWLSARYLEPRLARTGAVMNTRVNALAHGDWATRAEMAKADMRDHRAFYDIDRYIRARQTIEDTLEVISVLSGVHIGLSVYNATLTSDDPMKAARAIAEDINNPIRTFYDEVALPELAEFRPDVVCLSLTYHFQVAATLAFAHMAKVLLPDVPVVIGGALVRHLIPYFETIPDADCFVDYLVSHEGESALQAIVAALRNGRSPPNLYNVHVVTQDGLTRPKGYGVEDVNASAMMDLSWLRADKYLAPTPMILLWTNKGCYFGKCAFCNVSNGVEFPYRQKKIERVRREIAHIVAQTGARHFMFADDALHPRYLRKLFDGWAHRPDIYWQTETRLEDDLTSRELCEELYDYGCRQLIFGFESASPRVLDLMQKANDVVVSDAAIHNLSASGIAVNLQCFVGFPGETEDDALLTYEFLEDHANSVTSFAMGSFILDRESIVAKDPGRFGVEIIGDGQRVIKAAYEYKVSEGLQPVEARKLAAQFLLGLLPHFPANYFFLDGAFGAHAMLYSSRRLIHTVPRETLPVDVVSEMGSYDVQANAISNCVALANGDWALSLEGGKRFVVVTKGQKSLLDLLDGDQPVPLADLVFSTGVENIGYSIDNLFTMALRGIILFKREIGARTMAPHNCATSDGYGPADAAV